MGIDLQIAENILSETAERPFCLIYARQRSSL